MCLGIFGKYDCCYLTVGVFVRTWVLVRRLVGCWMTSVDDLALGGSPLDDVSIPLNIC